MKSYLGYKGALLGTVFSIAAFAPAYAADDVGSAVGINYVKVCNAEGDGYYYLPGANTCLKIYGDVKLQTSLKQSNAKEINDAGILDKNDDELSLSSYARGYVYFVAAQDTELGKLKGVFGLSASVDTHNGAEGGDSEDNLAVYDAYVSVGGFKAGFATSVFGFGGGYDFMFTAIEGSGRNVLLSYTKEVSSGFKVSVGLEDTDSMKSSIGYTGSDITKKIDKDEDVDKIIPASFIPNLTGSIQYDNNYVTGKLSGVVSQLTLKKIDSTTAAVTKGNVSAIGWAAEAAIAGKIPSKYGTSVLVQAAYAQGASGYTGLAQDVIYNPEEKKGIVDALIVANKAKTSLAIGNSWNVTGAVEHKLSKDIKFDLTGTYGVINAPKVSKTDLKEYVAGKITLFKVGGAVVYTPVKNLNIGLGLLFSKEVTYGDFGKGAKKGKLVTSSDSQGITGVLKISRSF